VTAGTGRAANIGEFAAGKTGTTENYQDAWFVGFTDALTVAVWVGYPEGAKPMETEYRGEPVAGGTFPAEIWRDFMLSVKKIRLTRNPDKKEEETPVPTVPAAPAPVQEEGETAPKRERTGKPKRAPQRTPEPEAPAPEPAPAPAPEPEPAPAPTPGAPPPGGTPGGDGSGGAAGGAAAP
jgi:penicillin-binding protein 1A